MSVLSQLVQERQSYRRKTSNFNMHRVFELGGFLLVAVIVYFKYDVVVSVLQSLIELIH